MKAVDAAVNREKGAEVRLYQEAAKDKLPRFPVLQESLSIMAESFHLGARQD